MSSLAKGARSPKSKFGAALEALNHNSLTIYKKPQRNLYLFSKAETRVPLRRFAKDYDRFVAIAGLISVTQEPEEANAAIFRLLCSTL